MHKGRISVFGPIFIFLQDQANFWQTQPRSQGPLLLGPSGGRVGEDPGNEVVAD